MRVLESYPWICERFANVKEESGGMYCSADCPLRCHRKAQLRFWVGENGGLVFTCYAGCNKLEILRSVGASWKDCYPDQKVPRNVKQEVTAVYEYRDERGVMLYQTLRLEPGTRGRDKDFRQRRPVTPGDRPKGRSGWAWNLDGVRRVLYRLPDLLAADPVDTVFVVAGEKDCDSLARLGLVATTNVCGERAEWLPEYSETLAGRFVVVIEDNDSAGKRHTNEVCGSLLECVATLRRVRLPAKDSTAFLMRLRQSGITAAEDLRQELWNAVGFAPAWIRE